MRLKKFSKSSCSIPASCCMSAVHAMEMEGFVVHSNDAEIQIVFCSSK